MPHRYRASAARIQANAPSSSTCLPACENLTLESRDQRVASVKPVVPTVPQRQHYLISRTNISKPPFEMPNMSHKDCLYVCLHARGGSAYARPSEELRLALMHTFKRDLGADNRADTTGRFSLDSHQTAQNHSACAFMPRTTP